MSSDLPNSFIGVPYISKTLLKNNSYAHP